MFTWGRIFLPEENVATKYLLENQLNTQEDNRVAYCGMVRYKPNKIRTYKCIVESAYINLLFGIIRH